MSRKIIAFYLPQYYPTPYNDEWWGKDFTEWTNVSKARPLFKGHYQPKIPTELGYYNLRNEDSRIKQANLAKEYGIDGFCYWHYWFAGRRLLNDVFEDVLKDRKPDFPFCLCWANHSWYKKTWAPGVSDELLIEQTYPGEQDFVDHFYAMLPAFKDSRYLKDDEGKLIFGIFSPLSFDAFSDFKLIWNELAEANGLNEFSFFGYLSVPAKSQQVLSLGFDSVVEDYIFYGQKNNFWKQLLPRLKRYIFKLPKLSNYNLYIEGIKENYKYDKKHLLCVLPNYDHSPRSGLRQIIFADSEPEKWGKLLRYVFRTIHYNDVLFVKSWNEWGEGNYLEPDVKYGREFLEMIRKNK